MLYRTCPKCGYQRSAADTAPASLCPSCGLIFSKWLKSRFRGAPRPENRTRHPGLFRELILPRLLVEPTQAGPVKRWGRAVLYLLLLVLGIRFIAMDHLALEAGLPEINASFMHGINLVFHEAGHVLLIPFGDFMSVLGGSLMQLLIPSIVIGAFLWQRDPFAASLGLWWFGQSLLDLAPYIADARAGELLLLGGVTGRDAPDYHDWHNLLGRMGLLDYDHALAALVYGWGASTILLALAWGGYLLWGQHRRSR